MAECLPTQRIHQSVRLKITGFLLPLLWHFGREESICTMSNYLSWKNSVVKNRTWTLFIGIPTHYHSEVVPSTYDALCFICLISIFSTLFWALWRQGSSLFFFISVSVMLYLVSDTILFNVDITNFSQKALQSHLIWASWNCCSCEADV